VHVPYRGSAPAMTDLVGGQVQLMTNTLNDSLGFIREGKLRALAVTSPERSDQLPDVPTVAETVAPGFGMGAWQGVVAPAGTPAPVVDKLNAEIRRALQSPEMQKQLKAQGAQALGSTPQEYAAYIKSEIQRWGEVVKAADVKLD
jgi:tripartite-type tricarboxylate transporter receptor subunit TctC